MLQGDIQGDCGVCRKAITAEYPGVVVCIKCRALYHPDCWEFNGDKCAVYGCAPVSKPAEAAAPAASTECRNHADVQATVFCTGCRIPLCGACCWTSTHLQPADPRRYCDDCVPKECFICSGNDHFPKQCGCLWLILVGGALALVVWALGNL